MTLHRTPSAMEEPITPDELHAHIQGTIFGRRGGRHFDRLQAKLHELVDRPSDLDIIRGFVKRVEHRAEQLSISTGSEHSWLPALMDELFTAEEKAMKGETK